VASGKVLGLWVAGTEGAKFWLIVITELKNRGVEDIFIACCDGLKGFPEGIETGPASAVLLRRSSLETFPIASAAAMLQLRKRRPLLDWRLHFSFDSRC
jgi:hypothetical protein